MCVWDRESRHVTELYLAGLLCSLCEDRGWWNQVSRCLSAFKLAPLWAALLSFRAGEICALLTPHQEKLQHRRLKSLYSVFISPSLCLLPFYFSHFFTPPVYRTNAISKTNLYAFTTLIRSPITDTKCQLIPESRVSNNSKWEQAQESID